MSTYATIVTKTGPKELPAELNLDNTADCYGNSIIECWEELTLIAIQLKVRPLTAFQWTDWDAEESGMMQLRGMTQLPRFPL